MVGFKVVDPKRPARDVLDEHPYLRGLTPEQQRAYGRHLLARRTAGARGDHPADARPAATSSSTRGA